MTAARLRKVLGAVALAGAAVRLTAFSLQPPLHPDEIFQYLEPAWRHLHGVGWEAWEYRAGVRSWVLPAYHGAWMVLLSWLGVRSGAAVHAFFRLHWALASLLLVWAGWRAGCALARRIGRPWPGGFGARDVPAGWEGGLWAAALVSLWPTLAYFSPHTLSEIPSMILLAWGYALATEAVESAPAPGARLAVWSGLALGLGACLRVANAPLVLVPLLFLMVERRSRDALRLAAAMAAPLALFGLIDRITLGRFLHSFIAYLDYNLLQGRAVEHGRVARTWYLEQLWARLGSGFAVLLPPALLALRATWPWVLGGTGLLAYLSSQAHQEERFIVLLWPLFLVPAGAATGAWLAAGGQRRWWIALFAALVLLARNLVGTARMPTYDYSNRFGLYAGQAWVGRQPDATGVLVDGWIGLSGGYLSTGRSIPTVSFDPRLLENPVFDYVVVKEGSRELDLALAAGFSRASSEELFAVLRRGP